MSAPPAPDVSVVIPVRNGACHLDEQLRALAVQSLRDPWELLVVDNGSTDGTRELVFKWSGRLPIRLIDAADHQGVNATRNRGAQAARAPLLAFCDADDRVEPGWLEALAEAMIHYRIVGGRLDERTLNTTSPHRPAHPSDRLPVALGFLPFAPGANLGIRRDTLIELGGFDERFVLGFDDAELSIRAQLKGIAIGYAPAAGVAYRHREHPRALFDQFRSYGRGEVLLYRIYRDFGIERPRMGMAARRWSSLASQAPLALRARTRPRSWLYRAGYSLGRVEGSIRHHTLYL